MQWTAPTWARNLDFPGVSVCYAKNMSNRQYDLARLIDPKGPVYRQAEDLYTAVLGHESERMEYLRKALKVSKRHFSKHLKLPASQPNKTMLNFSINVLGNMAKEYGVELIIVPTSEGQTTLKVGSAAVLDENTDPPGWSEVESVLLAYSDKVVRITKSAVRQCRNHEADADAQSLYVVGSMAIQMTSFFLRHFKQTVCVPTRLSHALPFAPIICQGKAITPLDRFFCQRANMADNTPATTELLWRPDQQGDAKSKQLQRWRFGKIRGKGCEIPSNFVCASDYIHRCEETDVLTRRRFEAVKVAQGLWRYLHQHDVPDSIISEYLCKLLGCDDGCPADPG
ncbi:hypothetical protein LBMAG53_38230 [Planctomycetota bacterium]|nr:hypothetical protein LBMAG53_38230 [Planctomycetota bacterium]